MPCVRSGDSYQTKEGTVIIKRYHTAIRYVSWYCQQGKKFKRGIVNCTTDVMRYRECYGNVCQCITGSARIPS